MGVDRQTVACSREGTGVQGQMGKKLKGPAHPLLHQIPSQAVSSTTTSVVPIPIPLPPPATPAPAHPNEPATRPTTATGAAAAVNAPAPASNAPPPTAVAATWVASCTLTEDRLLGGSSKETCLCSSRSDCETMVQDARQACEASFRTARTRASELGPADSAPPPPDLRAALQQLISDAEATAAARKGSTRQLCVRPERDQSFRGWTGYLE